MFIHGTLSKKLPRSKDVDHVDVVVLVLHPDVLSYVRLYLAQVIAVRTLESRFLTALVPQMTGQVSLPSENASTIRIRTGEFVRSRVPVGKPMMTRRRGRRRRRRHRRCHHRQR